MNKKMKSLVGYAAIAATFAALFALFRAASFDVYAAEWMTFFSGVALWSYLFWGVLNKRRKQMLAAGFAPPPERQPILGSGFRVEPILLFASKVIVAAGVYWYLHR